MDIPGEDDYRPSLVAERRDDLIMISGCSGGGKSSLLDALSRAGQRVWPEPGRQVVKEQMAIGGDALPWLDLGKFVDLTISRSMNFMISAAAVPGQSFFDRGIIDQISGLEHAGLPVPDHFMRAAELFRYRPQVFIVPPWREVYRNDSERQHGFDDAVSANEALVAAWKRFGYQTVIIPRASVGERARFVLDHIHNAS